MPGFIRSIELVVNQQSRKARRRASLTQEALSSRDGLDRTYISMLEHDKKSPTLEVLFRLCDALDVPASLSPEKKEAEATGVSSGAPARQAGKTGLPFLAQPNGTGPR